MQISFTELGRLCRYDSRCGDLFIILEWRATDLLVWNSVDTTCKEKCIVVILVDFVTISVS